MARNRKIARKTKTKTEAERILVPPAWLKASAWGALTLAVVALSGWGAISLLDRPIQSIRVTGSFERVTPVQVEAALGDLEGKGFLGADLEKLRRRVETLPWVDEAVMGRSWPAELVVRVVEQVPAARWRERGLLNVRGELFLEDARHIPAELPELSGPAGAELEVAGRYLDMKGPLAEAGHVLTAVQLDERGAWRIRLGSGMTARFGRDRLDERFQRFVEVVVPLLATRDETAAFVDLRYTKGFSVAWTVPGPPETNNETKGTDQDV